MIFLQSMYFVHCDKIAYYSFSAFRAAEGFFDKRLDKLDEYLIAAWH